MDYFRNTFYFAFSAILVLILGVLFSRRRQLSNDDKVKRKKRYHPVAGTMFSQLLNFNTLWDYMTDQCCRYKTYRLLSPFRSEVYTSDPANVEYILKTNFQNYGKGSYNYNNLKDLLGDGIFTVDGDKWRHQRKTSSYEFSTGVLRKFSSVVFQKNAAKLARVVSEDANSKPTVDIFDLFLKATLDSTFQVGFGIQLDSMCGSSDEGTLFANAFDDSSEMTAWRYVDASWTIKRFLNIGSEAKLKKNVKVIDEFVYKLIHTKIDLMSNSPNDASMKKDDILSRFLASNVTDPKYLRDIILNFIIAGRDTTAATLSWFLYMLCKHPHIQVTVAQEVREATRVKDNLSFEEFAALVTEEALEKMQYLHAAITETLRLHPAVPMDPKICFSDDTLPDGFDVKKGDMVAYVPYAMGRMKFIWGDDAEVYRPERWLNKDGVFQNESPFKFTAFQAGPRICLGKEFAYRQMKIFSAVLLQFFTFKLADETKVVNYRTMINLHIKGGLHLHAFLRTG
ncbi:cytochrome P450 704C1-like [Papaver somniferum]|uniref:cytochrome P450 704C1-like n=1 Tax=Papaver somniferum TaxID=3469 RepID=UPI000E705993|nr:cytochrome P450 704C1-like [Papaver somniferum]